MQTWKKLLPWIKPFYAIKSNPGDLLIDDAISQGTGFDCASKNEIKQVLKHGVDPKNIVFSNPIKSEDDVIYA